VDKHKIIKDKLGFLKYDIEYLESMKERLKLLEEERELRGITYDDVGGGHTNTISDITGETAVRIAEEEIDLKVRIKKKQAEIDHLERILASLPEDERQVIVMFYCKNHMYWKIAEQVGCSISTVKRLRRKGFEKLRVGIFGS
jgi:RNA polymerase sigma factor (sigma-70 family)